MRKLIVILAVTIAVAACTPEQVALVTHQEVRSVTKEEVVQFTAAADQMKKVRVFPKSATTPFLEAAARLHNDPFLACTRAHESDTAGGYRAYNPGGPYFGAYQFLQNTWNNSARAAGLPQFVGADILNVPGYIQDYVAMTLYRSAGNGPWGGRC